MTSPEDDQAAAARREEEPGTPAFLDDGTPVSFQTFMIRAIPGEPGGSEVDEVIARMEQEF